ncbi:DMT family transporter [Rehaibacterium terrae]|jgi:drug/metabolite transporter (DMT)-like permease|uniref:Drug/metabolite transporter (DMT)-like permease n=1 Tax=Rehaibacterium terrae TaxID=1341696 RepID=A0A7W7Y0S3_9GAMM|nr:DMT family transporter [Rehaibacterium terrae]MBB5015983.1 drug/metabolite transporter (DMT)-like permease [Rehaibacterium terrae]
MKTRDLIDLLLLGALWGASFLFMRLAAPEFGPIALVEMRVGMGALFLGGLVLLGSAPRQLLAGLRGRWLPLTVLALTHMVVPFALFAYAALTINAGYAAIINATAPLWAGLIAVLWLRDRLGWGQALGLLVGFAGVVVLVSGKLSGAEARGAAGLAFAACTGAAILYGFAVNYAKRTVAGVPPLLIAFAALSISTLILLPPTVMTWPARTPGAAAWLSAIALGVASTGLANLLYYRLLERIGPARAITVTYLIPVFGVSWGALFLGEAITATMLLGGAVVLLGVALANGLITPALLRRRAPAT